MEYKIKENETTTKRKSILLKIIIPILIIVAVGAMWIIKTQINKSESQDTIIIDGADFSLNVSTAVDYDALFECKVPVIVDYGSDSCIPCQQMAPVLETLNKEMACKAFIKFVDVWKYTDAANDVPIQVIPTQILFNTDGTPFVPSDELAMEIEFMMYSDQETKEHIFTTHQGTDEKNTQGNGCRIV